MKISLLEDRSELVSKAGLLLLRVGCVAIAIYMSAHQFERYIANEDKATVTYRKFHDTPLDQYPTYTICFEIKGNIWRTGNFYNETYLLDEFGISKTEYQNLISDVDFLQYRKINRSNHNVTDITKIDFEKAAKHPKNIISDVFVGYNRGEHIKLERKAMKTIWISKNSSWVNPDAIKPWVRQMKDSYIVKKQLPIYSGYPQVFPLYKSYQDYKRICLTRKNEYRHRVTRDFEHITLWISNTDYSGQI